jgi:DNA-binding beta-propeller fold protein YncE
VINLSTYELKSTTLSNGDQAQAVAITPDGTTVLFADYWNMAVSSYAFNSATGALTHKDTTYLGNCRPVNLAISPDGKTVIAVDAVTYKAPVITFYGDKKLYVAGYVTMPTKSGQSVVFNHTGTKAYYLSSSMNFGARVNVLNIAAPGVVTAGPSIQLSIPRGTSQLFGVDTIAIDPSGNYLYVTNPTLSGGVVEITVVDLTTNTEVNQLHANGIPTGIAFATIDRN